jgi:hypothetical protein
MDDMDYSSAKYPTFPRKFDQNAPLGEEEAPLTRMNWPGGIVISVGPIEL